MSEMNSLSWVTGAKAMRSTIDLHVGPFGGSRLEEKEEDLQRLLNQSLVIMMSVS